MLVERMVSQPGRFNVQNTDIGRIHAHGTVVHRRTPDSDWGGRPSCLQLQWSPPKSGPSEAGNWGRFDLKIGMHPNF